MKTFKTLLAAVLMLTAAVSANAQSVAYPRFHLGLRAGVSVNFPKVSGYDINSLTFPQGGVSIDFRLAPIPLYFETGVYYMNKGYSSPDVDGYNLENAYNNVNDWLKNGGSLKAGSGQSYCHVLYLPILLSYHYYLTDKIALQPFVGGIVGGSVDADHGNDDEFEGALRFGMGFNLGRLYLNVGYDLGLTETKYNIKNNSFFATLGVNIIGASR